ncbi:MAG: 1-deoxy-D-xylulose-5-phosphate reductoisomerase [Planctomycetaceae bacterium]|jgi:1-deoxy-D-xylulose-5-phosphate reductoisomerase|nr:1-deoxy-D-xylulose-5-phosphate reductoisomerase [Planctomycetaceae bacterium]
MRELPFPRRIAILGSSGSIGRSALEVVADSEGKLVPVLLSVHRQTDVLAEQIRQMTLRNVAEHIKDGTSPPLPRWVVVTDETADRSPLEDLPPDVEVLYGHNALCKLVQEPEVDIVLSAIVGSAGLTSTWSALEAGKTVALANKESLVMGGALLPELAKKTGGRLIPVDSEHSAVMQCLSTAGGTEETGGIAPRLNRIILTASGGPFRTKTRDELENVTVQEALSHPTWKMGKKITIDSATLMNKALEIIEARWFFDVPVSKINVMIHPQSVVHSLVEFIDGSVIAQMSPPDMKLPIQTALNYPYRLDGPAERMDWRKTLTLDFYPPDLERFPAISLGLEVAEIAGTAGAVVNAANEVAVAAFLNGTVPFLKIVEVCRSVLAHHQYEQRPTLEKLLELDSWARKETERIVNV